MRSARMDTFFDRVDRFEMPLCIHLNRICLRRWARGLFAAVSRLGDGVFWYVLIAALPVLYGPEALATSLRMAVAGVAGVGLYKVLKGRTGRRRPFVRNRGVLLAVRPLDRYAFPSGHTLHAVSFTLIAVSAYGELGWVLVPFALLVAMSRVVLGLHYPSDVAAGGLIGAFVAWAVGTLTHLPF
jgi:undecaprenyl-diphosphatase